MSQPEMSQRNNTFGGGGLWFQDFFSNFFFKNSFFARLKNEKEDAMDPIYTLIGCVFTSFAFLLVLESALDAVSAMLVRMRKALTKMTTVG
jgi:hypothetical protein